MESIRLMVQFGSGGRISKSITLCKGRKKKEYIIVMKQGQRSLRWPFNMIKGRLLKMKKTSDEMNYSWLFRSKTASNDDIKELHQEILRDHRFAPSISMREFWKKESPKFADMDIAAIICNSKAPYGRKFEALLELGNMTDDEDLKKSIGKCLYEEMDLHIRQQSTDYGNAFGGEAFANRFVNMNTPFSKGDIVKDAMDERKHGILMSGGWICPEEEIATNIGHRDYGDVQFRVEWLDETGKFYHEHVNPLYLDYYEPTEGDHDCEVLSEASLLVKGDDHASLQAFQMAFENWTQ